MSHSDIRPNVLLITADQYRFPRFSYGQNHGFAEPLKKILGFHHEEIGAFFWTKVFRGTASAETLLRRFLAHAGKRGGDFGHEARHLVLDLAVRF